MNYDSAKVIQDMCCEVLSTWTILLYPKFEKFSRALG